MRELARRARVEASAAVSPLAAQLRDQRARALDVVVVLDVAGDGGGIAALERQAQAVGRALLVLQAQELAGERLLAGHAGARLALARRDGFELRFDGLAALGELEQRAMRFAHGTARLAQLVGGLAARFFRRGEIGLQLLDAAAQLAQLLLVGRRLLGVRGDAATAGDRGTSRPRCAASSRSHGLRSCPGRTVCIARDASSPPR